MEQQKIEERSLDAIARGFHASKIAKRGSSRCDAGFLSRHRDGSVIEQFDPQGLITPQDSELHPFGNVRTIGVDWARKAEGTRLFVNVALHLAVNLALH